MGTGESPYKVLSAVVTSNRPAGMAVMALWFNRLEHGAAGWQHIRGEGRGREKDSGARG